jgi:hypothetical protein
MNSISTKLMRQLAKNLYEHDYILALVWGVVVGQQKAYAVIFFLFMRPSASGYAVLSYQCMRP